LAGWQFSAASFGQIFSSDWFGSASERAGQRSIIQQTQHYLLISMSRHERDGTSESKNKLDATTQKAVGNAIQSASLQTTMEAAVNNKMKEAGMLPELGGSMNIMMRQERKDEGEAEMVKEDHTSWDELQEVEESEQAAAQGEDAELAMLQVRKRLARLELFRTRFASLLTVHSPLFHFTSFLVCAGTAA
jgi:hypothetical protein